MATFGAGVYVWILEPVLFIGSESARGYWSRGRSHEYHYSGSSSSFGLKPPSSDFLSCATGAAAIIRERLSTSLLSSKSLALVASHQECFPVATAAPRLAFTFRK